MIYLDNGATSYHKPAQVYRAVTEAMRRCANPGRGGYPAAMRSGEVVFGCRTLAAQMFGCQPEQVAMTANCTHGLNIAISTLVRPGDPVVITGFEHNAVVRPLYGKNAKITVAGRRLFDWENTLEEFETALKNGAKTAVFTHVSNVFGYILPVEEMAALCRRYGVPFIIDAAQSAGALPIDLGRLGADFIAMPGHKGLLGPQGTGLLLCGRTPEPLLFGGTGSLSESRQMPDFLPDRVEAGTLNVPGIAGLTAGLQYLKKVGVDAVFTREYTQAQHCIRGLKNLGLTVFSGPHQGSTVSFIPPEDCEEFALKLSRKEVAVRAGLHCAPLAHESAETAKTGTVRISFGHDAASWQTDGFLAAAAAVL